mmetsp:Transcript_5046/g.14100  ORF Transcript_5046/g.14100 Transcript_5046/m.14100 type:complete len:251 (-) Transcript_5046:297-1049(-)
MSRVRRPGVGRACAGSGGVPQGCSQSRPRGHRDHGGRRLDRGNRRQDHALHQGYLGRLADSRGSRTSRCADEVHPRSLRRRSLAKPLPQAPRHGEGNSGVPEIKKQLVEAHREHRRLRGRAVRDAGLDDESLLSRARAPPEWLQLQDGEVNVRAYVRRTHCAGSNPRAVVANDRAARRRPRLQHCGGRACGTLRPPASRRRLGTPSSAEVRFTPKLGRLLGPGTGTSRTYALGGRSPAQEARWCPGVERI